MTVKIPCELTDSGFSGEKLYRLQVVDGFYDGVCPNDSCGLDENSLSDRQSVGTDVKGWITGVVLDESNGVMMVSIADLQCRVKVEIKSSQAFQ